MTSWGPFMLRGTLDTESTKCYCGQTPTYSYSAFALPINKPRPSPCVRTSLPHTHCKWKIGAAVHGTTRPLDQKGGAIKTLSQASAAGPPSSFPSQLLACLHPRACASRTAGHTLAASCMPCASLSTTAQGLSPNALPTLLRACLAPSAHRRTPPVPSGGLPWRRWARALAPSGQKPLGHRQLVTPPGREDRRLRSPGVAVPEGSTPRLSPVLRV